MTRRLKQRRESAGLSQSQLAARAGVPIRAIRNYEALAESAHRDINRAEALTVWRLSKALDCAIEDLLELEGIDDNV